MKYRNNQPFVQMHGWSYNDPGDNQDVFKEAGLLNGMDFAKQEKATEIMNEICNLLYDGKHKFTDEMCDLAVQIASFVYSEKFGFADTLTGYDIYNAIYTTTFGDIANYVDIFKSVDDYFSAIESPSGNRPSKESLQAIFNTFFYQVDSNGYKDVTIAEYTTGMIETLGFTKQDVRNEFSLVFGYYIANKLGLKKQTTEK